MQRNNSFLDFFVQDFKTWLHFLRHWPDPREQVEQTEWERGIYIYSILDNDKYLSPRFLPNLFLIHLTLDSHDFWCFFDNLKNQVSFFMFLAYLDI